MDAAFKTAKYPAYTTAQLLTYIAEGHDTPNQDMFFEVERRAKVKAGDRSVMTDGEKLRNS